MLPSRGPIQVTLDDTASRITHCRPTTQVRILRRPDTKPVTTIEEDEKPFDNAQTNSAVQSQQQQTKPQQQQFLHINKNPSQDSNYQKRQNCQQKKLNSTWSSNKHEHTASNNKKLLKTYQERADEYAKARLRILGSAFPEDEEAAILSNTCGDANKMMNLDNNQGTSTSTSSYYDASTSAYANCNSSILVDEQMRRLDAKIDNCSTRDNSTLDDTSVFTEYNNKGDNRNFRNINNQSSLPSTGCDSNCMGSKAK